MSAFDGSSTCPYLCAPTLHGRDSARGKQLLPCGPLSDKAASHNLLHPISSIVKGSPAVQVLAWLQPYLTDQFIKLAFHPETFRTDPALIEKERAWSNQNPPYMFRCTAQVPACVGRHGT